MTDREKRFIDEKFVDEESRKKAYEQLKRGTPLAYVLGEWYFYDEIYKVSPDCLIPQPDTEILVEQAIKIIKPDSTFLDLCTGSGCVGISILAHRRDLRCVAVDISKKTLKIAKINAEINKVEDRITFVQADILKKDFTSVIGKKDFSAIVSNPPYVETGVIENLSNEVKQEPFIALDGGEDGLVFYRRIAGIYRDLIIPGGNMALEIGYNQRDSVINIFGFGQVIKDYGGNDRVFLLNL